MIKSTKDEVLYDKKQNGTKKSKQSPYVVSGTASLAKLLPTGTILAFQSLLPAFANHGNCTSSNKYMTGFLVGLCTTICFLHSFTDSYYCSSGRVYFGIATFKGLYIFNSDNTEEDERKKETLKTKCEYRIRFVDVVHALTACIMFLTLAFADMNVQECLVPKIYYMKLRELFMNLPIGVGMLSSLVFLLFPTCRKNIGYTDTVCEENSEEDSQSHHHYVDLRCSKSSTDHCPNCGKRDDGPNFGKNDNGSKSECTIRSSGDSKPDIP